MRNCIDNASFGNLILNYANGNDFIRVYSDGWCEQGGLVETGSETSKTVNLLKSYGNTNYDLILTGVISSNAYPVTSNGITSTTFTIAKPSAIRSFYWCAMGYLT